MLAGRRHASRSRNQTHARFMPTTTSGQDQPLADISTNVLLSRVIHMHIYTLSTADDIICILKLSPCSARRHGPNQPASWCIVLQILLEAPATYRHHDAWLISPASRCFTQQGCHANSANTTLSICAGPTTVSKQGTTSHSYLCHPRC